MNLTQLIPNVSVGIMKFGYPIEDYLYLKHTFYPKIFESEGSTENLYKFIEPPLSVFVNDVNRISSISCHYRCFWKDTNLIGTIFNKFLSLANADPDGDDEIYILTGENTGQYQKVYDFGSLGLQIWTFKDIIVTVGCTNYDL